MNTHPCTTTLYNKWRSCLPPRPAGQLLLATKAQKDAELAIAFLANQESHARSKQQCDGCRQPRVIRLAHRPGDAAVPPRAARLLSAYRQRSSPAGWRRGGRGSRSCLGTRRPPRAGRHRSARRGARRPSVSPCARAPASGCMTRTNLAANNAACRRAPATAAAWARRRRSTSTGGGCVSRRLRKSRPPQIGAGVRDGAAARR